MKEYCNDNYYIGLIFIICIIIFTFKFDFFTKSNELKNYDLNITLNKKINDLENKYRSLLDKKQKLMTQSPILQSPIIQPIADPVDIRDRQVVNDELYPPISRTERPIFDALLSSYNQLGMQNIIPVFNYPTRGNADTFSLMGLAKSEKTGEIFNLFGRQKYSGSSIGEFYLMSTNKNNQYKIPLCKYKIKDYYNLPNKIIFKKNEHNILSDDVLHIQEYKKADLDSGYL